MSAVLIHRYPVNYKSCTTESIIRVSNKQVQLSSILSSQNNRDLLWLSEIRGFPFQWSLYYDQRSSRHRPFVPQRQRSSRNLSRLIISALPSALGSLSWSSSDLPNFFWPRECRTRPSHYVIAPAFLGQWSAVYR